MGRHGGKEPERKPFIPKNTGRWSGLPTCFGVLFLFLATLAVIFLMTRPDR